MSCERFLSRDVGVSVGSVLSPNDIGLMEAKSIGLLFSSRFKDLYMSIGVMKDYKLKLRDLHVSHTLGCVRDWNTQRQDKDEVHKREGCECDG